MKGRITQKLHKVLLDKKARGELGQVLSKGEDGRIRVGSKVYNVKVQRGDNVTLSGRLGDGKHR